MKATNTAKAHVSGESSEPRDGSAGSGRRIKAAHRAAPSEELGRAMVDALADILDHERRSA